MNKYDFIIFSQALRAFKSLGRFDLTNKMLITLANNAVS